MYSRNPACAFADVERQCRVSDAAVGGNSDLSAQAKKDSEGSGTAQDERYIRAEPHTSFSVVHTFGRKTW